MKTLIMAGLFFISACNKEIKVQGPSHDKALAQTTSPTPVLEAVPPPAVEQRGAVHKVDQARESAKDQTDLGLIKTEKTIVDKSCKVVDGLVKCKQKKKVKRKTI